MNKFVKAMMLSQVSMFILGYDLKYFTKLKGGAL